MKNYFVSNLKFIREKKGISQNKLAKMIGVNQTTIARWEDNNRIPGIDKVIDVANMLNIPISELVGKDLRFDESKFNSSTFEYTDEEIGLTVKLIPTNDVNWDSLSDTEKEDYINQAMDALYEYKRGLKDKKE